MFEFPYYKNPNNADLYGGYATQRSKLKVRVTDAAITLAFSDHEVYYTKDELFEYIDSVKDSISVAMAANGGTHVAVTMNDDEDFGCDFFPFRFETAEEWAHRMEWVEAREAAYKEYEDNKRTKVKADRDARRTIDIAQMQNLARQYGYTVTKAE